MNLLFFFRGWLIGISIAAVVGPMSVLCIQRTLQRGFRYGLISGLGIASADGCYGFLAAFGLTVITHFLVREQLWIRLVGGVFLCYLGIRTILTKPASKAAAAAKANNLVAAYISTLLLTLTNPLTILSFVAIFAGIGASSDNNRSILLSLLVVCGVFAGSCSWWVLLTSAISVLRQHFTPTWLRWINRISGVVITIFGVVSLLSLR